MRYKISFFLMLISVLFILGGCGDVTEETHFMEVYNNELPKEEMVIENESLEMHFFTDTTQFYIKEKKSGRIWYSNPADAMTDPVAEKVQKDKMNAQILLTYSQSNGLTNEFNNYNDSVRNGTYTYEKVDNGIKVSYSIGKIVREKIIPKVLSESRMAIFFDKMERSDQRQIEQLYQIMDYNNLLPTDDKAALLEKYPELENERMFILRDNVQEFMLERMETIFEKAGYTQEDFAEDKEHYSGESTNDNPTFNISIVYQLDGDDFLVSVPLDEIEYKTTYPVTEISTLTYFGAGEAGNEGFLFVPDGSGAIIRFDGKNNQSPYRNNLYGFDNGQKRTTLIDEPSAYYPVFGLSNQSSFICVLEDGASYASIEADVSGRLNSYNYVYSKHVMAHGEDMDIASRSNSVVKVFEKQLPQGMLTQRYIFVDSPDYVDMAVAYREYLMDKYPSLQKMDAQSAPVAVEIVGAVDKIKRSFGVPASVSEPLTTYSEASEIVDKLFDAGMSNMSVKYSGWFNKGVKNSLPDKIHLISQLGSKRDFEKMVQNMDSKEIDLFLESEFTYINGDSLFDGFNSNKNAAKYLSRERIELYPFSPIWYGAKEDSNSYFLASPSYTLSLIDKYYSGISKLGVNNISFMSIGKSLNSDFNDKRFASRQDVLNLQQQKLADMSDKGSKLMISGGNDYAIPYVDFVLDMELATRGYNILDEEIPFYQIALHGLVPFAGEAINLASNYEKNLLKTYETGAGLYFVFMKAPGLTLVDTDYTKYYAADFSLWFDTSTSLYSEMNDNLAHTYNQFITGHKKLDDGVYRTVYEDGTEVVVNYSSQDYLYKGTPVGSKSYYVERAGE